MADVAQKKVVILGGGLTGISAAMHLRRPWVLFEKDARLGGHARTDERDGFRFDKTGHWLHLRDAAMKVLITGLLPDWLVEYERRRPERIEAGTDPTGFGAGPIDHRARARVDHRDGGNEREDGRRHDLVRPQEAIGPS